jgi:capsular polysaccharide biosynthesis protein
VTDREFALTPYLNGNGGLAGRPGVYNDDLPAAYDWGADPSAGLVSLAFLKAAIRRSAAFCCVMTIVGLLIGGIVYVVRPAPYQADATILVTDGPYEDGQASAGDDQALGQSPTVANLALQRLGLHESVSAFLNDYLITVDSQRVLVVTFTAPSAEAAVSGANAVAVELLRFRVGLLVEQQDQAFAALNQQIAQAELKIKSIHTRISQALVQPPSPALSSRLHSLRADLNAANAALTNLQQAVLSDQATVQPATTAAIKGSKVLAAAYTLPRSHLKRILIYPGAGLIIGLVLAIAIVLIRAIVSDKLRRRDDVANAVGAPVRLSTGPLQRDRRLSLSGFRRRNDAARAADVGRIAAHLGRAIGETDRGFDGLVVVAVDDPEAAALPLVLLATSCAQRDKRVVLADLADGAPAARLLGSGSPGVSTVDTQHDARLVIAVPEGNDVAPFGPLGRVPAWDQHSGFRQEVSDACASADLLFTLVTLDPSVGSEHLPTWAADAAVIVTAGRSTWTKINAVGEMIRLSGARLVSAVLVGADCTDESLGTIPVQQVSSDAEVTGRKADVVGKTPEVISKSADVIANAVQSDASGLMLAADDRVGHRSVSGDLPRG